LSHESEKVSKKSGGRVQDPSGSPPKKKRGWALYAWGGACARGRGTGLERGLGSRGIGIENKDQ